MQYYYSPLKNACFVDSVHGTNIPDDCIKITVDEYRAIDQAKSTGNSYVLKQEDNEILVTNSSPQLSPQEQAKQHIAEIQQQLTANDLASVRPLRAKVAGTATEFDETRLAELEAQAQALRTELATLNTKLQELSDQPTE